MRRWLGISCLVFCFSMAQASQPGVDRATNEDHGRRSQPTSRPTQSQKRTRASAEKVSIAQVQARARKLSKELFDGKTSLFPNFYPRYLIKMQPSQRKKAEEKIRAINRILDSVEILAKKGIIYPGHPKTIRYSSQIQDFWMTPSFLSRTVQLRFDPSYEELEKFFKSIPSKKSLDAKKAELEQRAKVLMAKTGIAVRFSTATMYTPKGGPVQLTYPAAKKAIERLESVIGRYLPKAVASIELGLHGGYNASSLSLSLKAIPPYEWDKQAKSIPLATLPEEIIEMKQLQAKAKQERVQKAMLSAMKELKKFEVTPIRAINQISENLIQQHGVSVYFDGGRSSEEKLKFYQALAAQKISPNRPKIQILFSKRQKKIGPATVSGRIAFPVDTPLKQILKTINAVPTKSIWDKQMENVNRRIEVVKKQLSPTVNIFLDSGLISHDQALQALATFENIAKQGYRVKDEVRTLFLTGSQVGGYPGVSPWNDSGDYLVVRSDFALKHLRPYLIRERARR